MTATDRHDWHDLVTTRVVVRSTTTATDRHDSSSCASSPAPRASPCFSSGASLLTTFLRWRARQRNSLSICFVGCLVLPETDGWRRASRKGWTAAKVCPDRRTKATGVAATKSGLELTRSAAMGAYGAKPYRQAQCLFGINTTTVFQILSRTISTKKSKISVLRFAAAACADTQVGAEQAEPQQPNRRTEWLQLMQLILELGHQASNWTGTG
ncbi:hypothetical protein L484_010821 [Morus notabilis]|uniref:Uncharacterized protein n=1 Tax=Morus notabilis TaxID=981085 RepID=W9S2R7_9ROSA|nr:hypothetical protein L484_010821 [Morus notabilis]